MNDKDTAWKYAFSTEMERKNNLRQDYGSIEYEVIPNTSLEDLLSLSNEVIKSTSSASLSLISNYHP